MCGDRDQPQQDTSHCTRKWCPVMQLSPFCGIVTFLGIFLQVNGHAVRPFPQGTLVPFPLRTSAQGSPPRCWEEVDSYSSLPIFLSLHTHTYTPASLSLWSWGLAFNWNLLIIPCTPGLPLWQCILCIIVRVTLLLKSPAIFCCWKSVISHPWPWFRWHLSGSGR